MKKAIFITAFLCLAYSSIVRGQNFNISGKIDYSDTLIILFGSENQVDTLISPTGKFSFSRKMKSPELLTIAALDVKNKRINSVRRFFAYDGSAHLESDFSNLWACQIQMSNNKYNAIYEGFRERFNPLVSIARKVIDTSYSKQLTAEGKGLCQTLYDFINEVEGNVIEKFISSNSNNIVGAYIFNAYFNVQANVDKAQALYAGFTSDLLTCSYLKEVRLKIEAAKKIVVGLPVPKITVTSISGDKIELGKDQDKYTVIDFWGTWCGPCLKGLPKMKKCYQSCKNKVNFIGVAYDDNKSEVKKLIEAHRLDWAQIVNNDQDTDLVKLFNIYAASTKVIIDKEGKILKIFVGETDDFYSYIEGLK